MLTSKTLAGRIGKKEIYFIHLENDWMKVSLSNFGATICSIHLPDKDGVIANVVLGYNQIEGYINDQFYMGSTVGRVTGRISNSQFKIKNKTFTLTNNEIPTGNHLHGGMVGFNKKIFDITAMEFDKNKIQVELYYRSTDMEEGYPGNLDVWITYTLTTDNILGIHYKAITDKETHVNLTNHSYFNLTGNRNSALEQELIINAKTILETDQNYIPTGKTYKVVNTDYDFTIPHKISLYKDRLTMPGYNECYILDKNLTKDAILNDPESGRKITVCTSYPCILFYTGDYLNHNFSKCEGVCLETQFYPDAPNHPEFGGTLLLPGQIYNESISLKFSC